jgi:FixJ family two-component response regulator
VVLIVDDDDAVRTSLLRLLRALGFVARGYASGEAFLADLSGPRADCVVLDLLMPTLQGDRVVAAMRQVWPDVPVIFITGSDEPGMDDRLMGTGGRAWFMKPVDPRVLVAEIQAATRGSRREA